MSDRVWGWIASGYIAASVLLGGASAAGAAANGFLQIGAVVLIVMLAWVPRGGGSAPAGLRTLAIVIAAYLVWLILQLVPLPPAVWTGLPGRAGIADSLRALGADIGTMPLSLAPRRTVESMLWLLPPAAMFLLVLRLPSRERRRVAMAVIGMAVASVVLGAFQVMGGEGSPLRFYEITSPDFPVGFFSNKNHLATLLLSSFPLLAAVAGRDSAGKGDRTRRHSTRMAAGAVAGFILIGVAINGSLAGYALLLPTAFASALIYRREIAGSVSRRAALVLAGLLAAFVAAAMVGPINSEALSSKFGSEPSSRKVMTARTIEAATDHFPVGSGLGSFQQIYRTYEDPAEASRSFANHAHNDYVEVALELGLPGILLILLFLAWWTRRSLAAWRGEFSGAALARGGSVIVGIVLFHSLVDYPIRTSAMAAVFAAACAFLLQAPVRQSSARRSPGEEEPPAARHLEAD